MQVDVPTDRHPGHREVARATRFPISAALLYRGSGESAWSEGTTVNISRTGVLFRPARPIPPQTMLEFQILFPAEVTGGMPANVVCRGPVVRTQPPDALAASIRCYRLLSGS